MLPKSIRWRLPLSYASIALLAALALGVVLLTTLRGYYGMREHDILMSNADFIGDMVARNYEVQPASTSDSVNAQIGTLSLMSQARIRLFDAQNKLVVDSGDPLEKQVYSVSYAGEPPGANVVIWHIGQLPAQTDANALFASGGMVTRMVTPAEELASTTPPQIVAPASTAPDTTMAAESAAPMAGSAGLPPDQFAFAVASSPFGVGLRRDFSLTTHSAQTVDKAIYDSKQQLIGKIEVSNGPAYGTEIIEGMTWVLVGAGAVAVLLAAVVGWFMSRTMTAPLLLLTDATAQMANGELSTRVSLKRNDEFGVLAHSFDVMAQRVEGTVTALRRFVADAAHQIHTPLTAVHADLEHAASEPDDARRQMFIERALTQLKRLEALTNDLLDLSRLEARVVDEKRTMVDLVLLVRDISEAFASRAEQAGIAFNLETSHSTIMARINEIQFRHAIGNLLDNAIKFTPENGTITVSVKRDGDQVELCVNDTGIGISAEDLPQLFSRFHRGRNAAAYPGSGLGLAIIKAIIDGHHGQISVESSAGNGTHFALRVPLGAS